MAEPAEGEAGSAEALAAELGLGVEERELVGALLRLGISADRIREAVAEGRLEGVILEGVLDPERERRTVSIAEIEAEGGMPAEDIQASLQAFGLPPPDRDESYFTPEEARVYRELGRLGEVWPADVRQEVSRVYGQSLARIAQTELHVFRSRVEPLVRETTESPLDALAAVRQAFSWLLPLADPILLGIHRRKLEQEMTQAAVWEVESAIGPLPGMVEVSLLFLDLRHFTSFANRNGDAAAVDMIERLGDSVQANLGAGRLVKQLGDGYLLAFPAPDQGVDSTVAIAAEIAPDRGPALHAGLQHGDAVFRDGDYYGRAVNLAARLLGIALDDELLTTREVAEATPERPWQTRGRRALYGFQQPIEVFALDLRAA